MKITILQGATRLDTERSVSQVYIDFFKTKYKEHSFEIFRIAKDIVKIEDDEDYFSSIIDSINSSELVLWVLPVFSALVPSQVKRFIELVHERGGGNAFNGRYMGGLFTSGYILDESALNYLKAVCEDLGARYVESFSATQYYPLINKDYKKNLRSFMDNLIDCSRRALPVQREFREVKGERVAYEPANISEAAKSINKRVTVITDISDRESNLAKMVDSYVKLSPCEVNVINLNDYNFSDCLGCWNCCPKFVCRIKDGFQELYDESVLKADAVIFAGEIKDRFLSAKIKRFIDREFCYNHALIHKGKLFGVLVSGALSENSNIRQALTGIVQLRSGTVLDYVSDETANSEELNSLIERLAVRVAEGAEDGITRPLNFAGVGAQRVIRDMIYIARFPFVAVHKHFKANLFKGFPQKRKNVIFMSILLRTLSKFKGASYGLEAFKEKRIVRFREKMLSDE